MDGMGASKCFCGDLTESQMSNFAFPVFHVPC
jgi:hypothetical protein